MKDRVNSKQVTVAIHPGYVDDDYKTKEEAQKVQKQEEQMAKAAGVEVEEIHAL